MVHLLALEGLNWCHACLFTRILKVGCVLFWVRNSLGMLGYTPSFGAALIFYFRNDSFNHGTFGLGVLGYWGSGFQNYDARLFNFGYVSSYSDFDLYFDAGIGFYYDSCIISLSFGHVSGSNTGFWKCNTIYIIDKGSRLDWFNYWFAGCIFVCFIKDVSSGLNKILGSLKVQKLSVAAQVANMCFKYDWKFQILNIKDL
ncbi:hypothetical protein Tco_1441696, partial [Tanacetum coccineum]